jgi:competence protein ComEA
MVYVAGYVLRPGVYPVRPEARARDALALAGGARSDADLVAVNLAAHVRDGDEIVVPPRGAPAPNAVSGGHGRSRRAGGLCRDGAACRTRGPRRAHRSGVASDSGRDGRPLRSGGRGRRPRGDGAPPAEVDINTADADTLAMVPGIGGGLAKRIVEFREQNGAFASIDELLDVAGITEHRLDAMLPYVIAR